MLARRACVIHFSGSEREKFRQWKIKTEAILGVSKKCAEALVNDLDIEELSKNDARDDNEEKRFETNAKTWQYLVLALQDQAFDTFVVATNNKSAYQGLKAQMDKYESKDVDEYIRLNEEFQRYGMKNEDEGPTTWINRLEIINDKMGAFQQTYKKIYGRNDCTHRI